MQHVQESPWTSRPRDQPLQGQPARDRLRALQRTAAPSRCCSTKRPYENWGEDEVRSSIAECYKWVQNVSGPLNAIGDAEGCRIENGRVKTPTGFKDAWKKLYEAGWPSIGAPDEFGGAGAPRTVMVLLEELRSGANVAFNMYPGLAFGVCEVIEAFGTPEQKKLYLQKMFSGEWGGTMCLTEPHAGSDVGSARTRAVRNADGSYAIHGTKIFISGGDHDMAENIIHLVLARVEGAAPGTKGLTLFIVPRVRHDAVGKLGETNDVNLGNIEHKMGINGSATCVLNFGEADACIGWPVGGDAKLHQGMAQMFVMMNGARIAVGVQGLSVASSAYLNALEYAKDRKQGASIKNFKDATAPRVAIIEHPDVRRMLLDMKSKVEHTRARAQARRAPRLGARAQGQGRLPPRPGRLAGAARQSLWLRSRLPRVRDGVAEHGAHATLGADVKRLGKAQEAPAARLMQLLTWSQIDTSSVPLNANRFLEMMSETAVAWMLLEGAIIADQKRLTVAADHPDAAFYAGKIAGCALLRAQRATGRRGEGAHARRRRHDRDRRRPSRCW